METAKSDAAVLLSVYMSLERILKQNLQKGEGQEILSKIVMLAHGFNVAHNLGAIFLTSRLESSLQTHLKEAIAKLGKYYAATYELVCAARDRNCRVFRSVQV